MPPADAFNPIIGQAQLLQPGLRRIVAPNPSPMTYRGTNTYVLGTADLVVIDPGPDEAAHLDAILAAVGPGQSISHIVVSHGHLDHAPLARPLQVVCGAPIYAFGPAEKGRSEIMQRLAAEGLAEAGEGVDLAFAPDQVLADGDEIRGSDWQLQTLHTPGHMGNHICLAWQDLCFTADHVMGWASSLVSPPDGDLTDFMTSCAKLQAQSWSRFYPGHGDVVQDPQARLAWLVSHRRAREAAVLDALGAAPADAGTIARMIYTDTPEALMAAATRNVLAHLIDLTARNRVIPEAGLEAKGRFLRI